MSLPATLSPLKSVRDPILRGHRKEEEGAGKAAASGAGRGRPGPQREHRPAGHPPPVRPRLPFTCALPVSSLALRCLPDLCGGRAGTRQPRRPRRSERPRPGWTFRTALARASRGGSTHFETRGVPEGTRATVARRTVPRGSRSPRSESRLLQTGRRRPRPRERGVTCSPGKPAGRSCPASQSDTAGSSSAPGRART